MYYQMRMEQEKAGDLNANNEKKEQEFRIISKLRIQSMFDITLRFKFSDIPEVSPE